MFTLRRSCGSAGRPPPRRCRGLRRPDARPARRRRSAHAAPATARCDHTAHSGSARSVTRDRDVVAAAGRRPGRARSHAPSCGRSQRHDDHGRLRRSSAVSTPPSGPSPGKSSATTSRPSAPRSGCDRRRSRRPARSQPRRSASATRRRHRHAVDRQQRLVGAHPPAGTTAQHGTVATGHRRASAVGRDTGRVELLQEQRDAFGLVGSPMAAAICAEAAQAAAGSRDWSRRPSARSRNRATRWRAGCRAHGGSRRGRRRSARSCRGRGRRAPPTR